MARKFSLLARLWRVLMESSRKERSQWVICCKSHGGAKCVQPVCYLISKV
jgi:hypothetical protein